MSFTSLFSHFARWMARMLGHPLAFGMAVLVVIAWALLGPVFHFSDSWQLVINTGTTIITFLMVFLIQNSQTRDSEAMQLKLDELIRALKNADNSILNTENLTEQELQQLQTYYAQLAHITDKRLQEKQTKQRATTGTKGEKVH